MNLAKRAFFILAVLYSIISACNADFHPNWKALDRTKCGKSLMHNNQFYRIVGGVETQMGMYPWMARLGRPIKQDSKKIFYYCGGSLINKNYVITAAHCIHFGPKMKTSTVRLGEYNTQTEKDCENGKCAPPVQDFAPASMIVHRLYNTKKNMENDIALIRLDKPAQFNTMVSPICLPYSGIKEKVGLPLKVAGWGNRNKNKTYNPSPILLELRLEVVPFIKCFIAWNSPTFKLLRETQICAGGKMGYDACTGDSGGPLMGEDRVDGDDYRYYLKGIVSSGDAECGSKNNPGIYTKVTYFMHWILDNLRE